MSLERLRIEKLIIRTLVYSDIFDYPLTKEEVWRYLISNKPIKKKLFEQILDAGVAPLLRMTKRKFYFLKNRSSIVQTRARRGRESLKKIKLAKKVAGILSKIPTIQLIALSGALAMNNSEKDDDIDFFVITSKNCLWVTRLLALILLQIMGYRRHRRETNVSNKVCLNMFLSEDSLGLPKKVQDLYTAHELIQLQLLFNRDNTYNKFLSSNKWVGRYLPNAYDRRLALIKTRIYADYFFSIFLRLVLRFSAIEYIAREFQLWYMRKHRSSEIVTNTLLAFHPKDYRKFVLKEYNKRLVKYKLV